MRTARRAAHSRLTGLGKFSTYDSHYPEKKLGVARFEVHHAKEQAKKLGPQVQKLVDKLFATDHPLRHLRRAHSKSYVWPSAIRSRLRLWSMPWSAPGEPQGWLKLFEDPVIGEAIVDRLIHPSQKITLKGEKSYREKFTENKSRLKTEGGLS